MLMTDELFVSFGFYGGGNRWEHEKYYYKYSLWFSTRKGYPTIEEVLKSLLEASNKDAVNNFKTSIHMLFAIDSNDD